MPGDSKELIHCCPKLFVWMLHHSVFLSPALVSFCLLHGIRSSWNVLHKKRRTVCLSHKLQQRTESCKHVPVTLLQCTGRNPFDFYLRKPKYVPISVAARSKTKVCCRSPAEIVGSNPAGGKDVCML